MLPLKDDVPTRSFPVVTVVLIAVNALVYFYQLALGIPDEPTRAARLAAERYYEDFIYHFGLIPCRLADACPPAMLTRIANAQPPWLTVFTSMFVHGGLFHVAGNMLYLWIFGNNVEDAMGKGRFVVFYLLCGIAAALSQYLPEPASAVPMIGASGAISGTLGAYLILYPRARVLTLVWFGWFWWRLIPVPAVVVLGFWIVVQVLNSVLTFTKGQPGGVAWLAHVGGFVAGMALIGLFRRRPEISYRRF